MQRYALFADKVHLNSPWSCVVTMLGWTTVLLWVNMSFKTWLVQRNCKIVQDIFSFSCVWWMIPVKMNDPVHVFVPYWYFIFIHVRSHWKSWRFSKIFTIRPDSVNARAAGRKFEESDILPYFKKPLLNFSHCFIGLRGSFFLCAYMYVCTYSYWNCCLQLNLWACAFTIIIIGF